MDVATLSDAPWMCLSGEFRSKVSGIAKEERGGGVGPPRAAYSEERHNVQNLHEQTVIISSNFSGRQRNNYFLF